MINNGPYFLLWDVIGFNQTNHVNIGILSLDQEKNIQQTFTLLVGGQKLGFLNFWVGYIEDRMV